MQKRMRPILGTYVEIAVDIMVPDEMAVIEQAFSIIQHIHDCMSFQQPESDISKLNLNPKKWLHLHRHTIECLTLARAMSLASHGIFNPTIGGVLVQQQILPNHGFIDFLAYGDGNEIEICEQEAKLNTPVLICLDGIAKGYAVDCAIKFLRRQGGRAGWVNAGGDIRVFGDIQLPICLRNEQHKDVNIGTIQNCAIATSISREQYDSDFPAYMVAKQRHTGCFSVLAQQAWRADALTKIACSLNFAQAQLEISRLGGHLMKV